MKFFVMGGTGFIGGYLLRYLLGKGHEVMALVRDNGKAVVCPPGVSVIQGDPLRPGGWQTVAAQRDVILNMVGSPIMTRWTVDSRREILESRLRSTRLAVDAILEKGASDIALINANAIGYYGDNGGDNIFTEESACGKGFLAEVTARWQDEALRASKSGARVVSARFGVVLGAGSGILGRVTPIFRLGLGGRLGSGRQWFSWIHVHDLCRAILFAAADKKLHGAVNLCSPNPVTNIEFTGALADILHRPAILPVPVFALRLVLGEAAVMAIKGQRVMPAVLEKAGFVFDFPTIKEALEDLLGN